MCRANQLKGVVVLILNSLQQMLLASHFSPEIREYCDWETFNGTCTSTDRVILIESARYGRMRVGRCVSKSYGHIGCGTDVTSDFERACSGRQACSISVISLHEKRSCPKDFTSFLEVAYICQKVTKSMTNSACMEVSQSSALIDPPPSGGGGLIASTLSPSACPWVITVRPHQKINLTLVDFTMSSITDLEPRSDPAPGEGTVPGGVGEGAASSGPSSLSSSVPSQAGDCLPYAVVSEGPTNATICGGRRREGIVYLSNGNELKVYINTQHVFMLKYQAFGCPLIRAPLNAWTRTNGQYAVVQCNSSSEAWYLTCKGTQWVGEIGNCSIMFYSKSEEDSMSIGVFGSHFPVGILIVVTLGVAIGVALGVLTLVSVMAYIRRRRVRKTSTSFRLRRMLDACGTNSMANIEESVSINPTTTATEDAGRAGVSIVLTDDRQTEVHEYCRRQTATLRPCSLFLAGDVTSREIQTNQSPSTTITTLTISSVCEGVNSPPSVDSTLPSASPSNVCSIPRMRTEHPGTILSPPGERSNAQRTPSERNTNDKRCSNDCRLHARNYVVHGDSSKAVFSCPFIHPPPFLSSSLQRMPSDCDPDVVQTCALCRAAACSISQSRQSSVSGQSVRY